MLIYVFAGGLNIEARYGLDLSIFILVFSKTSILNWKKEFSLHDKEKFLLASFTWCMMLISSVKAYEYFSISVVVPLQYERFIL